MIAFDFLFGFTEAQPSFPDLLLDGNDIRRGCS